jgi:hypothetical protein
MGRYRPEDSRYYLVGLNATPPFHNPRNASKTYLHASWSEIWSDRHTRLDPRASFLELPEDVCDRIAYDFDLEFDAALNIYALSETTRDILRQKRPSFELAIGNSSENATPQRYLEESLVVTLPYEAFDHELTLPSGKRVPYFPIRSVSSGHDIVLGRVLFQEM